VGERAECAVAVDNVDLLAHKDAAQQRPCREHGRQDGAVVHGRQREMVHLQAAFKMADADAAASGLGRPASGLLEVGAAHDNHVVAAHKKHGRKGTHVRLHAARVRMEEVGHERDPQRRRRRASGLKRHFYLFLS
jgi:hypothetical protein